MLRMEKVSKSYQHRGRDVIALDGASLDIPQGDFVSVVGPSGSGKSTLLLMLGGMLSPSAGRVLLSGQSIYELHSDARARLRVAEADEQRARRDLVARIRSAVERARAAEESLEALETVERDLERVERSVRERYRLGAVAYLEYIDGLRRLDEVRTLAIEARLDRLRARLALASMTGDLTWFPLPEPDPETHR